MNIQLSIYDYFPENKINMELRKQRRLIKEFDINYLGFWYYLTPNKCCNCYPKLKTKYKGNFEELSYCQCENCGRSSTPVDDYSWIKTKKNWDNLIRGLKHD